MLKQANLPSSNNSKCVLLIIGGAKKRRALAIEAVKQVNEKANCSKGFTTVK